MCVRVWRPAAWTEAIGGGRLRVVDTPPPQGSAVGGFAFEAEPEGPGPEPGAGVRRTRIAETASLDGGGVLSRDLLGLQGAVDVLLCSWTGSWDPGEEALLVHLIGCFGDGRHDMMAASALALPSLPDGAAGGRGG